jgi:ubiquitin-protein ligase
MFIQGDQGEPPTKCHQQLAKEFKNLDESPTEGIKVIVNDDDFTTICADIEGPGEILSRVLSFSAAIMWGVHC